MAASRLDELINRLPELQICRSSIEQAYDALHACFKSGGKLLLCGNGGSASDADHWAGELLKGFGHKRPLSAEAQRKLPAYLAQNLQGAVPAIPLTGFSALTTAFCNDVEPDLVFAQLTLALGRPGDVLVALSTSGNAKNVGHALETARAQGLITVGLSGSTGGRLRSLCDVCICVPSTETYRVQEYHLPIYHCLSLMLEDAFFG
ncbi:MAG: SIS domain-containing protein [Opitutus sp.]